MILKPIVVAVAAAMLSAGAFAGGGEHSKQQPRAESGSGGMMQSQTGQQQAGSQGNQQQAKSQGGQQAEAQSPELVKQAQQALKDKGLNAGPVDGQWGPQTQQAVKVYQQQNQIQATGQLDRQTLASLGIGQSASAGGSSQEPSSSAGSSSPGVKRGAGASGSSGSSAPPSSTAEPQKDSAGAFNGHGPNSQKD
jgi:peptidoglycan hydrolase-like protein with peptidoglycan-binding domain